MSELQYGVITSSLIAQLKAQADEAEKSGDQNQLLRNRVTDEEIAEIVSANGPVFPSAK